MHSGTTGGLARNPIGELSALLAEMYDARTGRVRIPGLRRRGQAVGAGAQGGRARGVLAQAFRTAHELHSLRPARDDLAGLIALTAAPTLEVHGFVGGYAGPGIKTIVPHRAEAKLSTRLVPDQQPAKVFNLIKRFVKKRLPDAVVTHEASLAPYLAPLGGRSKRSGGGGDARDVRQGAGVRA